MAKQRMRCVFSGQLCRECALFRGRHYYLCFARTYRGYLGAENACEDTHDRQHALFNTKQIPHDGVVLSEKKEAFRPGQSENSPGNNDRNR